MNATSVNMTVKNPTSNKSKICNIPYINPNCADSSVSLFLATLNNTLSDNTLEKLEKIARTDLQVPQV